MSGGDIKSIWCDRRRSFAEVSELLANRMIDVSNAGGSVLSVSHAVDPSDPEGAYSVIVVAEAPEEIRAEADIASSVVPSDESS